MKSEYADQQYIDDSVLLDGLYEFHPAFFSELDPDEWEALRRYYLTGQQKVPASVIRYRQKLRVQEPTIENQARQAFRKVCRLAGME